MAKTEELFLFPAMKFSKGSQLTQTRLENSKFNSPCWKSTMKKFRIYLLLDQVKKFQEV